MATTSKEGSRRANYPISVTRHCHGKPIPYRRKLIGQKLKQYIASMRHAIHSFIINHATFQAELELVLTSINTTILESQVRVHVLALELPQLSM